nr:CRISPR-associated helicase Cas3' [Candidatus Sigynarchaeota archaeon]
MIAGGHDAGKGFPEFQAKWPEMAELFRIARPQILAKMHHGAGTSVYFKMVRDKTIVLDSSIGIIMGSHHGVFPLSINSHVLKINACNEYRGWMDVTSRIVHMVMNIHDYHLVHIPYGDKTWRGASSYLAGLVSVADWIASDAVHFPFENTVKDEKQYQAVSMERARVAMDDAGFFKWHSPVAMTGFVNLFPECSDPRPMQRLIIDDAKFVKREGLVIIEALMGEGKTEAALFLADAWMANGGFEGLYYALPTQATSKQMFGRVESMLKARYPKDNVAINLVHGHAAISAELKRLKKGKKSTLHVDDDDTGTLVASDWFTYRKRGLLCPFGIGTIDQALLSVLQTRHFFVRLFGLGGKVVIFDEVHAYDAYMLAVLNRLLTWLAVLGSPVIILSATLSRVKRKQLLEAYNAGLVANGHASAMIDVESTPYPRVSSIIENTCRVVPFTSSRAFTLQFKFILQDEEAVIDELKRKLVAGGCLAVICNTVKRAQQLYAAISKAFKSSDVEVSIIHARFMHKDREDKEDDLLRKYGKKGEKRPRKGILVATQVVEQSLDLDFDFMISDLAPVDLLFQRSGRMHRHERPERPIKAPELCICSPENGDDGLVFGKDNIDIHVYDEHILLRTWLLIKNEESMEMPGDIDAMIEEVYGEHEIPEDLEDHLAKQWMDSMDRLQLKKREYENLADVKTIANPSAEADIASMFNKQLEEDDYEMSRNAQALTRISAPSLPVVLSFENDDPEQFSDEDALSHSLNASQYRISDFIDDGDTPSAWKKNPLLRFHRVIRLDTRGQKTIPGSVLEYNQEVGMTIKKTQGATIAEI